MAEGFYSTGKAARQLQVSPYHFRKLCQTGQIAAETTRGAVADPLSEDFPPKAVQAEV